MPFKRKKSWKIFSYVRGMFKKKVMVLDDAKDFLVQLSLARKGKNTIQEKIHIGKIRD